MILGGQRKEPLVENIKYYRREYGGIVRLINSITLHSLDQFGFWIPNQRAISMFYDEPVDYEEIAAEEVEQIISSRKNRK